MRQRPISCPSNHPAMPRQALVLPVPLGSASLLLLPAFNADDPQTLTPDAAVALRARASQPSTEPRSYDMTGTALPAMPWDAGSCAIHDGGGVKAGCRACLLSALLGALLLLLLSAPGVVVPPCGAARRGLSYVAGQYTLLLWLTDLSAAVLRGDTAAKQHIHGALELASLFRFSRRHRHFLAAPLIGWCCPQSLLHCSCALEGAPTQPGTKPICYDTAHPDLQAMRWCGFALVFTVGWWCKPACCPPSSVGKVLLPPVRAPWCCRLGSHARRAGPPPDAWRRRHRTGRMAGLPAAHGHRTQAPCWARVTARLRARQADRHAPHPQHYTCTLPMCARMLAKKPLGISVFLIHGAPIRWPECRRACRFVGRGHELREPAVPGRRECAPSWRAAALQTSTGRRSASATHK